MSKGMLGNSELLQGLFRGPVLDLLVKLNGEDGERVLEELNRFNRREPCWVRARNDELDIANPTLGKDTHLEISPVLSNLTDLSYCGPTFGDWLTAREKLHLFLTGETVNIREMFIIQDEILSRTDIMPIFRPAGATNRMALDWKVKLGMKASYEEVNVMKYSNSKGPEVPKLYYINRSVRPDKDTLGEQAKSPDDLTAIPDTIWTDLYGWSDADNLLYLITGNHLDSGETSTWFPNDRLLGGIEVASGYWHVRGSQAKFFWYYHNYRYSGIGVRVARSLSLKTS